MYNLDADEDGHERDQAATYIDDRSGKVLHAQLVRAARRKEIRTMEEMGVYIKIPRRAALQKGAKIIDVRWLDIDKAEPGMPPDVRSRCVAREFANEVRDDLFAGTPALEAIKMLISMVASSGQGRSPTKRLMAMDIKRAFLHAEMSREVYINLPDEAKEGDKEDMVGLLRKAMYGTRDAPQCWQSHVASVLRQLGFQAGRAHPCLYKHGARDLVISVHVDGFLCAGSASDLHWLREQLASHFESTSTILGPGTGEQKKMKYLNRVLEWTHTGITYEHDPKYVQIILKELGMLDSSIVNTPGVKDNTVQEDNPKLSDKESSIMRRVIAIMNYMSRDRMDIGYAVKECAREMARPTERTARAVKRLARYLKFSPRRVNMFRWQSEPSGFTTYSDADWAGCALTRRSTSGGIVTRGSHTIRHWSRTQVGVALSSGESELYALVKASTETLGLMRMSSEMGLSQTGILLTDSSAAKGTVHRVGSGRLKHIATNNLWVQEKAARGELVYKKIPRDKNFADLLTHHWDSRVGEHMLNSAGLYRV